MNSELSIVNWLLVLLLASGLWAQTETRASAIQNSPFTMARSSPSDFLFTRVAAAADTIKTQPKTGRDFWALVMVGNVAKAVDIESTQRWMRRDPGFRETNPLLPRRPTRARMYAQFLGGGLLVDYAAWRLRRAGHRNWARMIQFGQTGLSIYCAQYNLRHAPSSAGGVAPLPAVGPTRPLKWSRILNGEW